MSRRSDEALARIARLCWRALYESLGRRLPYRPRSLQRLRSRIVHGFAPGVDARAWINKGAQIGGNAVVMQGAGIGEGSIVPSGVTIRRYAMLGPECRLITGDHPVPGDGEYFGQYESALSDIDIGEDAFLGARVTVLPGVTIGRGSAIGAGAVVARDVPAGAVVVGNPAREVRRRTPGDELGGAPYPGRYRIESQE